MVSAINVSAFSKIDGSGSILAQIQVNRDSRTFSPGDILPSPDELAHYFLDTGDIQATLQLVEEAFRQGVLSSLIDDPPDGCPGHGNFLIAHERIKVRVRAKYQGSGTPGEESVESEARRRSIPVEVVRQERADKAQCVRRF